MEPNEIHDLLDHVLLTKEATEVAATLQALLGLGTAHSKTLTIVANAGVHVIPKGFLRGDVYEASRGDWNVATQEALLIELRAILLRLVIKLRSNQWDRIYLIPTGHPILSLQIKAMVYRVLRLNTIDLYYKSGVYFEINLDQRAVALEAGEDA